MNGDVSMIALTETELEALECSARLANLIGEVIGEGPLAQDDWDELAAHIHDVQRAILAQVAARAYPTQFRLLGQALHAD